MAWHLYRRHRRDCEGGHPEDSRGGEFEERRKGWKRCECVIYVSGTLAGRFKRRPTGKITWEDARASLTVFEAARAWDNVGEPTTATTPSEPAPCLSSAALGSPGEDPAAPRPSRVSIEKAIAAFLAVKQATVAYATFRKHRTFTKQLRAFAEGEGYVATAMGGDRSPTTLARTPDVRHIRAPNDGARPHGIPALGTSRGPGAQLALLSGHVAHSNGRGRQGATHV